MDSLEYLSSEEEQSVFEEVQACRHHMHQYPELSLVEFKTSQFIVSKLKEYGFTEIHSGIGETGVVGVLRGRIDESILLRADMDALTIQEKSPLEFASKNDGVMHACGHDTHVAMLLGAALVMSQKVKEGLSLKRGIKFCFQPGEENTSHGAEKIINDKSQYDIMDASPRVKNCVGFHISSQQQVGDIFYQTGPFNANSDKWQINIIGKGGHCMAPEFTIDATQIGVQISNLIYQIKGRSVNQSNPSTISIGTFKSGQGSNIVSDSCELVGSVRSVQQEDRQNILDQFQLICDGAALQHKCQIQYQKFEGSKQIINDKSLETFMDVAIKRVGNLVANTMGLAGEDFFYFADLRPSAFLVIGAALTGAGDVSKYLHHSSTFQIDEDGLLVGVKTWLSILQDWQK